MGCEVQAYERVSEFKLWSISDRWKLVVEDNLCGITG